MIAKKKKRRKVSSLLVGPPCLRECVMLDDRSEQARVYVDDLLLLIAYHLPGAVGIN